MAVKGALADTVVAAVAGYGASKALEQFSEKAMQWEPEEDRKREQEVRPGPPFVLAADIMAKRVLGIELDDQRRQHAGLAFHLGAGLAWTPVYIFLRRRAGWSPLASGLATGASQSLLLDEIITPAIGASAPNREYPASTHIRGLAAHLVYGLTMAALMEAGWKLFGRRPATA